MAVAVTLGPLQLVMRAALRTWGGKAAVTRWQRAATWGLAAGLLAAPPLAGATLGGQAAVAAAVLGLALPLLALDLFWRWLPLEWTLPLLGLGLSASFLDNQTVDALAGAALGAGLLWSLQTIFRLWRGVEALGTGDIWLAAGIGTFAGAATIAWVLALAALSALAADALQKAVAKRQVRKRWGVAYGSHMIGMLLIVLVL